LASSFRTPPLPQGRRRWEWLIASIAVNLVLIGLILSFLMGNHRRQPLVTWQQALLSSLSPSDAAIVQAATQRIADRQNDADAHAHMEFGRTRAILAVEPLDRDALKQTLNVVTDIRNSQQTETSGIFFEELTALSPEGRAKVLAAMERESHRYSPPSGH
jgi:hypothetical protein